MMPCPGRLALGRGGDEFGVQAQRVAEGPYRTVPFQVFDAKADRAGRQV